MTLMTRSGYIAAMRVTSSPANEWPARTTRGILRASRNCRTSPANVAAPCKSKHPKMVGEPGREVVIKMRGAAHAMEKQKRFSRAAPIQIVELHLVDGDESGLVGRLVEEIRLCIYRKDDQ